MISGTETRAHKRVKGERERERTISRTHRAEGERSRRQSRSRLRADRDRRFVRSASIMISRSTVPISPSPPPCDLAPRRTQLPLSLPSYLNLTGFDDFFSGFCPCFSGFCLFLFLFQTPENIFRKFF